MRKDNANKDQTICIRVSGEEKRRIKEKAAGENKSVSEYVADAAMAGLERRNSRDRKRVAELVKRQDILNGLFRLAEKTTADEELRKKLAELMEGEKKLWQC